MYYIKFSDPMTGMCLEVEADRLEEAVTLLKKAKDNLYFKGYPGVESEKTASDCSDEQNVAQTVHLDDDHLFDDYQSNYEDTWYPYGATLW